MNTNRLLYPELLSDSELLETLASLCVQISYNTPRSHLIEIFKKVAVPLPQRNNTQSQNFNYQENQFISNGTKRDIVQSVNDNFKKMRLQSHLELDLREKHSVVDTISDEIPKSMSQHVLLKRTFLHKTENEPIKRIKL